jgi:hypothetical protein
MKADGKLADVKLARTTPIEFHRATPTYQALPSGYGYIDLARLPEGDIDKAFDAIMKTPGLILDLRGYPDAGFSRYAPRFAQDAVPAVLIRRRVWHGPDPDLANRSIDSGEGDAERQAALFAPRRGLDRCQCR